MNPHQTIEIDEWATLARIGDLTLLQGAAQCAVKGDVLSMINLMQQMRRDGMPQIARTLDGFDVFVMTNAPSVSFNGVPHTDKMGQTRVKLENVTLTSLIAMTLSHSPQDGLRNLQMTDVVRYSASDYVPSRSGPWRETDETLLRLAIVMCSQALLVKGAETPIQPDCKLPDDKRLLWMLFQNIVRMVPDVEACKAFERAGLENAHLCALMDSKAAPTVRSMTTGSLLKTLCITGNLTSLHWALEKLDQVRPEGNLRDMCFELVRDLENSSPAKSGVDQSMLVEQRLACDADQSLSTLPMAQAMIDSFSKLNWLGDVSETYVSRVKNSAAKTLASHLDGCANDDRPIHPCVVDGFLGVRLHQNVTLAQHLDAWIPTTSQLMFNHTSLGNDARFALIESACAGHCSQVLRAASAPLKVLANGDPISARPGFVPQHGWPFACVMTSHRRTVVPANLIGTLQALKDAGFRFDTTFKYSTDSVDGRVRNTSFLHLLAASACENKITALVTCLEFGLSTTLKDDMAWHAPSRVRDPEVRAQWKSAEKSFLARQSALVALNEIGLADAKNEKRQLKGQK